MANRIGGYRSEAGQARFLAAYDEAMAGLPAPDAVQDLDTAFGTVRAYRFGPADEVPLVLLPGTRSSTPVWAANLPGLRRTGPVVALDLLGEPGRSVQTRPITDAADQAQWLAEAFGGLGLRTAHLLGMSSGGWSAVNLAVRHPDLVASVSTLDPANTFGRIGLKVILIAFGMLPFSPAPIRARCLRWLAGGARAEASAVGRLIDVGITEYRAALPIPQYPTDDQLLAITAPTLVIIAGRSIIHHPARAAARARLVPGAHVELWPDASHALNGEFPERIAHRVAALLARVGR